MIYIWAVTAADTFPVYTDGTVPEIEAIDKSMAFINYFNVKEYI